jgi:deoxyribodipyrimidine photolyase-like uncharacterized protein
MPGFAELNALDAQLPVPAFMWTGDTDMNCVRQSVLQLVEHAYTHHIQRLMVLGLFAILLGPRQSAGDRACPFTTLYWDFLERNRGEIGGNRRMRYQLSHLARKDDGERGAIRKPAVRVKAAATAKACH